MIYLPFFFSFFLFPDRPSWIVVRETVFKPRLDCYEFQGFFPLSDIHLIIFPLFSFFHSFSQGHLGKDVFISRFET